MKAYVIYGKKNAEFIEVEKPELKRPDDVQVKVKSMGICGTDIHIYLGEHQMSIGEDRIPGHEFAGIVEAVGSEVKQLEVGDRVVHEPISYCGECYACRNHQGNVCSHLHVTGCNMSGGCEEYWCAPERQWHRIPDWMTWEQAAMVEPYTIGAQVCDRARVQAGDTVLIHGGGPIGLMTADVAKNLGAAVIVSEIADGRLELAKKIGADYVINPMKENLKDKIREITNGEGVNVILDCAGLARMMNDNMEMLSPAGRFVPVAPAPVHIDDAMSKPGVSKFIRDMIPYAASLKPETDGIEICPNGKISEGAVEVLEVAKANNMAVSTGHVSPDESVAIAKQAHAMGMTKIVFGHPMIPVVSAGMEHMKQFVKYGGLVEFTFLPTLPYGQKLKIQQLADAIRELGAENCILSSDHFYEWSPLENEMMRMFVACLMEKGITPEEIRTMIVDNPVRLLYE